MKKMLIPLLLLACRGTALAQAPADSNFVTIISAVSWMPEGRSLLLNIVKFDRTRKRPPLNKGFTYSLEDQKLIPMDFEGRGLAASPDGKTLAFLRQDENRKNQLYLYDLSTKKEMLLVADSFNKFSPAWSPDGKKIAYNRESNGRGHDATLEICIIDLGTKEIKLVTESGIHQKSYSPVWAPEGDKIVYYFEKGDNRDQVWLTDARGSFHTNLTNDTTTHNYYPSWIDRNTIVYTQAPHQIMTMYINGSQRKKVEGLQSFQLRYHAATKQAVYITPQPDNKLVLYDWEKRTSQVLLDPAALKGLL